MWIVLDQLAGLRETVLTDREWPDQKGMLQAREECEFMNLFMNHGEGTDSWLSEVYVPMYKLAMPKDVS